MDGRGSLRQLHQQVGGNCLKDSGRAFQWTIYEKNSAPPPLPSLPPWAMNSIHTPMHNGPESNANTVSQFYDREESRSEVDIPPRWNKPTSYFGSIRGLPPSHNHKREELHHIQQLEHEIPAEVDHPGRQKQEYIDGGIEHKMQNQQHEPQMSPSRQPDSITYFNDESSIVTASTYPECSSSQEPSNALERESPAYANQAEDMDNNQFNDLPIHEGFFRPWKKVNSQPESDNTMDNNDSNVTPTMNKWKVRAIMNPFAKRKVAAPAQRIWHSSSQVEEGVISVTSQPPVPTGALSHGQDPTKRPTTPLPAPSTLLSSQNQPHISTPPLNRRVLRSRGESRESNYSEPSITGMFANEQTALPTVQPPASFRSRKVLMDLRNEESEPQYDFGSSRDEDQLNNHTHFPTKPKPLKQVKPPPQGKPKLSTVDALAEIKRKREERRAQQAEEKQRIQTELKEHGDDVGYKFRRLIQKYRDALPPEQRSTQNSQTTLPPLPGISNRRVAVESGANMTINKLSVFIRKRPLAKKELKAKGYDIISCLFAAGNARIRQELMCHEPKWKVDGTESLENHHFRFDGVFDEWQANEQVYEATVGPIVPYLVHEGIGRSGNNNHIANQTGLTVFAYGQTGSGKTYTMRSMYRQAAVDIFERLRELQIPASGLNNVIVGVSFYEIYMNNVNDLLNGRTRVQMMEDGDGTVQLLGLKELVITDADGLLNVVKRGEDARATSANAVHDDSSRSHALLRITLYAGEVASGSVLSRLSMVDLAGSERACDTQTDNKNTRMEGAEINKSLLALKECIRALDRGATHIPFRQSKLTQLLRDSFLSENSKTIMIATISPWSESCNHTLNTLRYADRLKEIGGV